MLKKIIPALSILLLAGCSILQVHRSTIEQGNIIDSATLQHLHKGMTTTEAIDVMGTPMVVNVLSDSRVTYLYTKQKPGAILQSKRIELNFSHGRLQTWNSSFSP